MSQLGRLMWALDNMGTAARQDDQQSYQAALIEAKAAGASPEQVADAWSYGARRRNYDSPGLQETSFTVDGRIERL